MTSTTWTQTAGMDSGTDSDTVLSYAEAAQASADAAASSASAASTSASNAASSASAAGVQASAAASSASTALTHANTAETYATSANVTTVATNISNINSVGGSITAVNGVYGALTNIAGVYAELTDIGTVAGIAGNVTTVAGLSSEISSISSIGSEISAVNTYLTQIDVVYDNISSVRTLANNLDDIAPVLAVADDLATVGPIASDVTTVAGLESDILAVPSNVSAAQAAQAAAEAAYDSFDDRYLGAKASPPSTDNDGNALLTGALYWSTSISALYLWDGAAWNQAAFTAAGAVTSFNTRTGAVTLSAADVSGATGLLTTGGTMTGDLSFGDNDKAIFGAGSDLQIYHDGSNSYVKDAGTGNLWLQGNAYAVLGHVDGTEGVTSQQGAGVNLRYANSTKLTTTNTGVDVTGTITSDGLTVDGTAYGTDSATLSTTTQTAIASFAAADFDAGKVIITANDGTDSYVVEMLIAHDGTTAVATEYGQVGTGGALATYDVDISSGNVRILATPASATSTAFKVVRTLA